MPAYTNPLRLGTRVEQVAEHAKAAPGTVLALHELRAHPAIFNPFKVLRELWLDRALLLGLILLVSFQIFSLSNVFVRASGWWFWIPLCMGVPAFIFYHRSVNTDVFRLQRAALRRVPASARITGVRRVVHGHTHRERHLWYKGVEVLNNGTWSPAFHDVACTRPCGRKCFTWIRPESAGSGTGLHADASHRVATLYVWNDPVAEAVPLERQGSRTPDAAGTAAVASTLRTPPP